MIPESYGVVLNNHKVKNYFQKFDFELRDVRGLDVTAAFPPRSSDVKGNLSDKTGAWLIPAVPPPPHTLPVRPSRVLTSSDWTETFPKPTDLFIMNLVHS